MGLTQTRGWHFPFNPVLLAGPVLAASAALPPHEAMLTALSGIIVLGIPHGALDGEIGRTILRPRFGWCWFGVFAIPYLGLSALVLLAWHIEPALTLALFLAASVWHFGTEDGASGGRGLGIAVLGGLPLAAPILLHPTATIAIFSGIAGVPQLEMSNWLWIASLAWLGATVFWAVRQPVRRSIRAGLTVALFAILPPLTAFAIYFVCLHAPSHTKALIADPHRATRVGDPWSAIRLAMPITALTILIGAALWPLYAADMPEPLLALTIQGLAALTLPHMLLDAWTSRHTGTAASGA